MIRALNSYFVVIIFSAISAVYINSAVAQPDADEAFGWLKGYLQVDTINPPGNEANAVEFFAKIFDAEGIEWQSAESAPGRGNIWARIKGTDEAPGLILLHHSDVVPADMNYWSVDPLSGAEKDGYIYGRGAQDTKTLGIIQLASFIELHRSGVKPKGDIIYVASADEEAGGYFGVGWLTEHHPEIFEGVGMLLNEGGGVTDLDGKLVLDIEVTQKVPVWLRLNAVDQPGHGSGPRVTSSVTRIVQAMNRIYENPFPARIIPVVDNMFKSMADMAEPEWADDFRDMPSAIKRPGFLRKLQEIYPFYHALTRDACSLTRMGGSNKINVVPPEAWAEVDCRMLPDRPAEEFIADFKALLEGTGVEVETIMAFSPAISPTDNVLFQAIEQEMKARYPNAVTAANVSSGFTDSHFTRDLGIASYGFSPEIAPPSEASRVHGNDERTSIAAFKTAVSDFWGIMNRVLTGQ